jgi:hypothetical protein
VGAHIAPAIALPVAGWPRTCCDKEFAWRLFFALIFDFTSQDVAALGHAASGPGTQLRQKSNRQWDPKQEPGDDDNPEKFSIIEVPEILP